MPDEKTVAAENLEATSKPLGESQESTNSDNTEPFVSKAQSVADELDDSATDTSESKDNSDSDKDLDNLSDEELDAVIDKELSGLSEEEKASLLEELSNEDNQENNEESKQSDGNDKVQKRIDELVARAKTAEEKLEKLMADQELLKQPPKEKEKAISDSELAAALKDFIDEGDTQGVLDIINYKLKKGKEDLRREYAEEQRKVQEQAARKNAEWQTIVKEYSPDGYDNDALKSNPDFDISNNKSLLFQTAEKLYVKNMATKYAGMNGMTMAVQDAFIHLLKNVMSKPRSKKETEGLKNRLLKEQRKSSVGSGASSKDSSKSKKETSPQSELDEVLQERRAFKATRGAGV